jgi:hypothetical protein
MRNNHDNESFLRFELLALSLGKLPIPLITITEDVESYMSYAEEQRLYNKMPHHIKKRLRIIQRSVI